MSCEGRNTQTSRLRALSLAEFAFVFLLPPSRPVNLNTCRLSTRTKSTPRPSQSRTNAPDSPQPCHSTSPSPLRSYPPCGASQHPQAPGDPRRLSTCGQRRLPCSTSGRHRAPSQLLPSEWRQELRPSRAGTEGRKTASVRVNVCFPRYSLCGAWLMCTPSSGTHYEAMDVDTPPRPTPAFPSTATATTNPFHFAPPPSPPAAAAEPHLSFDPESFSPKKAFGLDTTRAPLPSEVEESTALASFVGGFQGETRRRRGSRRDRSPERRHASALEEEEEGVMGGLGAGSAEIGRRMGSSEFSFQVHHHHGALGSEGAPGAAAPERWLNKSTPYVLLG